MRDLISQALRVGYTFLQPDGGSGPYKILKIRCDYFSLLPTFIAIICGNPSGSYIEKDNISVGSSDQNEIGW